MRLIVLMMGLIGAARSSISMNARMLCWPTSSLSRTVNPLMSPFATSRSSRLWAVARATPSNWASSGTEARPLMEFGNELPVKIVHGA